MKRISTISTILLLTLFITFTACNKSNDTTTVDAPTLVTTDVIIDASGTAIYSGGYITAGDANAYGVVYSTTNAEPTLSDSKTSETVNGLTFSSTVTGLKPNTDYYIRSYGTYQDKTGYGNVIKINTGNDVSATHGQVSTFAGSTGGGFTNGTGALALFNAPMGVATDAAGNVYIADSFNSAIRKITTDGKVTTIAGTGTLGYVDGPGTSAQFYAPSALAVDATGNIYVADRGNNIIRKITSAGVVSTFAGSGSPGYADGTGTAATFNTPTGVAIDAAGNLYVADNGNNLIRKITSAGVVTTLAGSRTATYYNGTGTAAGFNKPTGIAVDATGNIYVTEPANNAIRKINTNLLVTTFCGSPSSTTVLGSPNAIAIDAAGNFWVTDGNGRVLKIGTDKKLSVLAGTSGTTGATNGDGASALFSNPSGIAVTAGGTAYVADLNNNLIRSIK